MENTAYLPAEPRCVLCLTCANAGFDHCSAGIEQYGIRFACDSYVRVFTGRGYRSSPTPRRPAACARAGAG